MHNQDSDKHLQILAYIQCKYGREPSSKEKSNTEFLAYLPGMFMMLGMKEVVGQFKEFLKSTSQGWQLDPNISLNHPLP